MKLPLQRWRTGSYVAVAPNPDHDWRFEARFRDSGLPVANSRNILRTFPPTVPTPNS